MWLDFAPILTRRDGELGKILEDLLKQSDLDKNVAIEHQNTNYISCWIDGVYIIEVGLPGTNKSNTTINFDVVNNYINVSTTRKALTSDGYVNKKYDRIIRLSKDVNIDLSTAKAKIEDGVLTLSFSQPVLKTTKINID